MTKIKSQTRIKSSKKETDGYILVTPCKNEQENLRALIDSVRLQSLKPRLWVIVDDGSTDNSPKIIVEASKKYSWIKSIRLGESSRDINFRYSFVCVQGFDEALRLSKNLRINYNYVALLDADIKLESSYFEKLIEKMIDNPKLGVISGGIYYEKKAGKDIEEEKTFVYEKMYSNRPMGAARLWRKQAFIQSGGYMNTCSPDSVSNIKVQNRGWDIRQFPEIRVIQTRETSSAEGLWKGYKAKGEAGHYIGTSPSLALIKSLKFLFKPPFYISLAYLSGYMHSWIKGKLRINDPEITEYYSNKRLKEIIKGKA